MIDEAPKTRFQARFDAVLQHLNLPNRAAFARLLGIPAKSARSASFNWYDRGGIPLKNREALERLGVSIDWLNDEAGEMLLEQPRLEFGAGADVRANTASALMRTHAFLSAQGGEYSLAQQLEAETFASAYAWITWKIEQGDQSPDTVFGFIQWERDQQRRVPSQRELRDDIARWENGASSEAGAGEAPKRASVHKKSTKR